MEQFDRIEQERIDFESIETCAARAEQLARTCYEEVGRQKRAAAESLEGKHDHPEYAPQTRRLEDIRRDFYALFIALYELRDFIGHVPLAGYGHRPEGKEAGAGAAD